jgi:hypothetical protein
MGANDQAGNKPADVFKSFGSTKDLPEAFHSPGNDLWHIDDRQHGFVFFTLFPLPILTPCVRFSQ